jgi:predicted nucleotidyltransferase
MKQFGLKPEQIDALLRCFAKYPAVEQVILYGSRAKGNFKDGSDIDLTIIDSDMTFSELLQLENMLDALLLPYKIDLSLKRQISNAELVEHIERAGKLFYERQVS